VSVGEPCGVRVVQLAHGGLSRRPELVKSLRRHRQEGEMKGADRPPLRACSMRSRYTASGISVIDFIPILVPGLLFVGTVGRHAQYTGVWAVCMAWSI
jgi:hypothetical protein